MIDKNIQQKFKNSFIFPYLERLKDSEYLVIYDKDEHIVSRFCKIGDKIYEIFNIFRIKDISDYAKRMILLDVLYATGKYMLDFIKII